MMKIVVLNCGSSTLKFQLIETTEAVIFSGGIGENSPAISEKICQDMESTQEKSAVMLPQARVPGRSEPQPAEAARPAYGQLARRGHFPGPARLQPPVQRLQPTPDRRLASSSIA